MIVFSSLGLPSIVDAQDLTTQRQVFRNQVVPQITEYCIDCHSGDQPEGDFDLSDYKSADHLLESRETWKKVLQRIQFEDMPPKDEVEMEDDDRKKLLAGIDNIINKVDCSKGVNPGATTIRRLNRKEYRNTIRDLIGVDYVPANDFPGDDVGYGFDRIGDVLSLPPILMEKYFLAAESVAKKAIVSRIPGPEIEESVDGKELKGDGSAKGKSWWLTSNGTARWRFRAPKKGKYQIKYEVYGTQAGNEPVKMQFLVNRDPVKTHLIRATSEKPITYTMETELDRAGLHSVRFSFLNDYYNPDVKNRERRDRNLIIKSVAITGPFVEVKLPETHRRIFFVSPGKDVSEKEAARKILSRFASRAFRRPATEQEVERLIRFVDLAKRNGDSFETGIRLAVQAILISPNFLFKVEEPPKPGATRKLSEYELATNLSYFVWSSMPDSFLFNDAYKGQLRQGDRLEKHVRRMLSDPRSAELVRQFFGQWLQLRNLADTNFDEKKFPEYNAELAASMKKETELFVWDVIKRDGSIFEFLDADFTFVDQRLAKHYEIKANFDGKAPDEFVKVSLDKTRRGGILTHASVLTITSNPTRTSPVKRGRWVLENLLNMPPPPPAPDAMELDAQKKLKGTLRERLQQHRENPSCASCHAQMDPIGFAMENFDPIGRWREKDENQPIDASGELPDGSKFNGTRELQKILLTKKRDQYVRCFVEKMMTFALGRGIEYYDRCVVDKIVKRLEKNGYRFSEVIIRIAESEPFQQRFGQPAKN